MPSQKKQNKYCTTTTAEYLVIDFVLRFAEATRPNLGSFWCGSVDWAGWNTVPGWVLLWAWLWAVVGWGHIFRCFYMWHGGFLKGGWQIPEHRNTEYVIISLNVKRYRHFRYGMIPVSIGWVQSNTTAVQVFMYSYYRSAVQQQWYSSTVCTYTGGRNTLLY